MSQNNSKKELAMTRVFDAPRKLVWEAWTSPEKMKRWWGPKDFTAPVIQSDFKVGGKYLNCMRGAVTPDGEKKDFWSTGKYLEIIPEKKLVMSDSFADEKGNAVSADYYGMDPNWPMEMTISVILDDTSDNKTKLTLSHSGTKDIQEKDLKDMNEGWNQSLDKLAESLK